MTILDFIAFIIYTAIFAFIFSAYRKKIESPVLRRYHKIAFWIKVFACFCYAIFVEHISRGDTTTLYFPEGYNLYKKVLEEPSNITYLFGPGTDIDQSMLASPKLLGYFKDDSNFMVIRLTAMLCFLSLGKYMVVNLFFAMFAFTGIWKLFLFFYKQFPVLQKHFAFAILFLPTFTFWSSGILKDPLAVSAMGWFTYCSYELLVDKKNVIKNSVILMGCIYLLSVVKVYILVAYLPALAIFLLLKNASMMKNAFVKALMVGGFILGSILGFSSVYSSMQDAIVEYAGDDLTEGIMDRQNNFIRQSKNEGSYFTLGVEFDASSPLGLLKIAPAAIVATLFRPFIWESRNVSTLLSSFESLTIMLFTLFVFFKAGIKNFFLNIFKRAIVIYCLFFSLVFAIFVGATTLNFGTLVRYKIPCMPFYIIALIFILYYSTGKNKELKEDNALAD